MVERIVIEPPLDFLELWSSGLACVIVPIPYQYANWAYWYLGFDSPCYQIGDMVINEAIIMLTNACRLRLEEIRNGN